MQARRKNAVNYGLIGAFLLSIFIQHFMREWNELSKTGHVPSQFLTPGDAFDGI
jgi:hypothetical protein